MEPDKSKASCQKVVIIQQADGLMYEQCLSISEGVIRYYCKKHGFTYWQIRGSVQDKRHRVWDKILLIISALELGFDYVVWIDADMLLAQDEDIRKCLPQGKIIGATYKNNGIDPPHYNAGFIVVRNNKISLDFFKKVWEIGNIDDIFKEQTTINSVNAENPVIVEVDNRWNYVEGIVPYIKNPVIFAWHGIPNRLSLIVKKKNKLYFTSRLYQEYLLDRAISFFRLTFVITIIRRIRKFFTMVLNFSKQERASRSFGKCLDCLKEQKQGQDEK